MIPRHWLALFLMLLCIPRPATAFDVSAYEAFLEQNRSLTTAELLRRHIPSPLYVSDLGLDPSGIVLLQEAVDYYGLSGAEQELLMEHGFMTSERLRFLNWGDALHSVWHADLPLFISSDMILHTVHISFREVLKGIEKNDIVPALRAALEGAHTSWPALAASYAQDPRMQTCLNDLDMWITVARSLLDGTTYNAVAPENDALVGAVLGGVSGLSPLSLPLFNDQIRLIDFSQFQPRGYYAENETLRRYFQCMMWLGRIDFRLSVPPGIGAPASVQREVVDAFLLRELFEQAAVRDAISGVDKIIRTFIGTPDNTTLEELDLISADLTLSRASDLWDDQAFTAFQEILATETYQPQAINSRILIKDPMSAEPHVPPYSFLILGQRFAVDSHVLGNVVYDHLPNHVFRGIPSPLDVLYALGNDDVVPLLKTELDLYGYAPNLGALRYLVDSYDDEFWGSSVYNRWLSAIRTLNSSGAQAGAPDFMLTGAWQQKQMNTQAASWAELRHDTILYVKQSYGDGILCSNPYGYVEPVPALYRELNGLAQFAHDRLAELEIAPPGVLNFYAGVTNIMQKLEVIAQKELDHIALDEEEEAFLRSAYSKIHGGCGDAASGWLKDLCYFPWEGLPLTAPDAIVADVHTQPTDAAGNMVGAVLHVGTVPPTLGVVIAGCPTSEPTVFVGPVSSMREYVSGNFQRLTDASWGGAWDIENSSYYSDAQFRYLPVPDWAKVYTANIYGNRFVDAPSITALYPVSIDGDKAPDVPTSPAGHGVAWLRNWPNPFNPRTTIGFLLEGTGPVEVSVGIYDVRGALIRTLAHDKLSPRTWMLNWDGTDNQGRSVSSGTYFAVISADGRRTTRKMVMVR